VVEEHCFMWCKYPSSVPAQLCILTWPSDSCIHIQWFIFESVFILRFFCFWSLVCGFGFWDLIVKVMYSIFQSAVWDILICWCAKEIYCAC
jgi:hypothetical protein